MHFFASHCACRKALLISATLALAACAGLQEVEGPPRKETVHAVTQSMELITFNAGQPRKVLQRKPVTGLPAGDNLVGLDYRVAKGVLYALSKSGRVYTLDANTGALKAVSAEPIKATLEGAVFGVDFNPVADRIRVVSSSGQNLRLHPDTGALAAADPATAYAPGDSQFGSQPELAAAGSTYNKTDEKLTTNYAIDRKSGTLVIQGSLEGSQPVVSPNTGLLKTVGSLGLGALADAALDIADVSGAAYAAIRTAAQPGTRLYEIDLKTGAARVIGTVADGAALVGLAIAP